MNKAKKIVILYSGGLDSFLMYHYAKIKYPEAEVKCLFFAHGQAAEKEELDSLPEFVIVRKVDWLNDTIKPIAKKDDPYAGAIYIPGRNLVFGVLAASQELANEVWMGTVWDEDNPKGTDKNEKFRNMTSELLSYVLSPFLDDCKLVFPFVEEEWTKEKCVKWALTNGLTAKEIRDSSISCWHPKDGKPCGECKQCTKRFLSFGLNGFTEDYVIHPTDSEIQQKNMINYLIDFLYSEDASNRDELNMVDMMIRFFKDNDPFSEQFGILIDQARNKLNNQ